MHLLILFCWYAWIAQTAGYVLVPKTCHPRVGKHARKAFEPGGVMVRGGVCGGTGPPPRSLSCYAVSGHCAMYEVTVLSLA